MEENALIHVTADSAEAGGLIGRHWSLVSAHLVGGDQSVFPESRFIFVLRKGAEDPGEGGDPAEHLRVTTEWEQANVLVGSGWMLHSTAFDTSTSNDAYPWTRVLYVLTRP